MRKNIGLALLLWALASTVCAASSEETVAVEMKTALGSITLELYAKKAPLSTADFLKYADAGLYENAAFYRTVRHDNDHGRPKITVIQGGLLDGVEPFPPIALERTHKTGIPHHDGVISLARSTPDSGSGAAFFICIGENQGLDFGQSRNPDKQGFASFGRVIQGMEVVRKINAIRDTLETDSAYLQDQLLAKPVRILSVKRVTGPQ